ncbi:MAG: ATP-binding protein [Bacteroidales bacterium]|nr:ATP-binding protein [Bacteroidales bacterium]MBN2817799.1 ATP-binding protein [Bacteroidales bacterium]
MAIQRYIQKLITEGEHQQLDFKFEISDAKKIARTFSAFANTNGGKLLIGVKDNGNISGIQTDEEVYMLEAAADLYCKPRVNYALTQHQIQDKTILEVDIPESNQKPHLAPWKSDKWMAFIRVDDQNFIANKVIYEYWKIKGRQKDVIVRYDDFEMRIFSLLKTIGFASTNKITKECKIPPYLVIKILAQLISINIIGYKITEKETSYFLK